MQERPSRDTTATPTSYRDPGSRVRLDGGSVVRHLGERASAAFDAVENTGLLTALVEDGLLHPYHRRGPSTIESRRMPLVTYPQEWTASMLKEAALLTLEIAARAWDRGVHLRDASAFNVVFDGGRPVFVDHGSFGFGHTPFWAAYGQFCDHFLNPLAFDAHTEITHRKVWSHSLEGLGARDLQAAIGFDGLRGGLFRHVFMRARLDRKSETLDRAGREAIRDGYALPPEAIGSLFSKLQAAVEGLAPNVSDHWLSYEFDNSYDDAHAAKKIDGLRELAHRTEGRRLAVDLGANTGRYSLALADMYEHVGAFDLAEGPVTKMHERSRAGEIPPNVTMGVADVLDPTPPRGLLGEERPSLVDRLAGADLFVWLALIHHLVVARNVPVELVVRLALQLGNTHIVEHVGPEDPMVQLLEATKSEPGWPIDRAAFEAAFGADFTIVESVEVTDHRSLYLLIAR